MLALCKQTLKASNKPVAIQMWKKTNFFYLIRYLTTMMSFSVYVRNEGDLSKSQLEMMSQFVPAFLQQSKDSDEQLRKKIISRGLTSTEIE